MSAPFSILITDADPGLRTSLSNVLELKDYRVRAVGSARDALEQCSEQSFDVLLLDIQLPDMSGFELISRVEQRRPQIDVLVMTGQASISSAAQAVRFSTAAYLVKPLDLDRLLTILEQIARRKHLERENTRLLESLRHAKAQWESTFDAISDPIAIAGPEGRIVRVNLAFCRRFNATFADILGIPDHRVLFGRDEPSADAVGSRLLAGGRFLEERSDLAIEGVFLLSCYSVRLDEGAGIIYILRDVTERKKNQEALWQREKELFQSQKMEAVGRLAGGMAHDFNNLLTIIMGNVEFALESLDQTHPVHERVATVGRAAERASLLTRQLLAFSKRQMVQPRACDLNTIVTLSAKMLKRLLPETIDFRTLLAPKLERVFIDPVQLEQILLNLILNARDAMPEGGDLVVETSPGPPRPDARAGGAPDGEVAFSVRDTGHGMDEETKERIFEPFFTTKEKGTGLGLSTVYGIVERSRGRLAVESEPGRGTTFHVYLPTADSGTPDATEAEPRDLETDLHRPATVLLVEDEEMIRELAMGALAREGYTVLTAEDGAEALAEVERHDGPVELLIADVVIPKLGGSPLAERLVTRFPGLRVLFISGYTEAELPPDVNYLEKPFTMQKLLRKVQQVLAGL